MSHVSHYTQINPDLTPLQEAPNKQLRDELHMRRTHKSGCWDAQINISFPVRLYLVFEHLLQLLYVCLLPVPY